MAKSLIESFLNHLIYQRKYSVHTIAAYRNDLQQFYLYREDVYSPEKDDVTSDEIRSWVVSLMEHNISPRSVNRKISSLKSYFNFLKREGKVDRVPTTGITTLKTGKRLPVYVNSEDMDRMMDRLEFGPDFKTAMHSTILSLLYHTGIRLTELIGLKISDVDTSAEQIKVLGKRNKERIVPLGAEIMSQLTGLLMKRKDMGTDPHLFVTDRGKQLYPRYVYRVVNEALSVYSDVSKRSPHTLRHTFATHLLRNGADLNAIKELLGHANLAATQIYTHNSIEHLKNLHKRLHPKA